MALSSWIRNWKRSIERRWALYQTIRRKNAARRANRPRLEALEDRWLLSTYIVTNTNNGGAGSLYDAITQANAGKFTEIDFHIGTQGTPSGMKTISPDNSSYLPRLTANGVFINGFSENQWQGATGTSPLIQLDGSGVTFVGVNGLQLEGSGTLVQGLFLTNWYSGIAVDGSHNTIGGTTAGQGNVISEDSNTYGVIAAGSQNLFEGNYIGTDVTGSSALPNFYGMYVTGGDNTIGGTASGAGNVISGNSQLGVWINTSGVIMEGNYIGLNAAGTGAIGNGVGISVTVSGNVINSGNVISGNVDGIDIHSAGVTVEGNYIGTNAAGTGAVGNSIGINVEASAVIVGGTTSGQANVISGNSADGIQINASGVNVENNFIGTDKTGVNPLGNGNDGVKINGSNNTVGTSNIISGNGNTGVEVSSGSGNIITQNSIFANAGGAGPGIIIDSSANNNIAAPTISSASITGYTLTVNGSFTAPTANVPYVLEFFGNSDGDAEGQVYIGSLTVTPTSTGTQNFTANLTTTVPRIYPLITATLTDNSADTSAFSNGTDATKIYYVTSIADTGTGSLRDAITQANNTTSGITTIDFNVPVQPPVQNALSTSSTGGSIAAGTYYYVITALTAAGETTISNEQSIKTTGTTSSITVNWTAVPGATGYNIYRSTTSGVYTSPALITTIGSGSTVTYKDTAASPSTGAPPSVNTAGPGGAQTISPATALPTLTANNIFINGLSQGGFGNTTPLITVDGTKAGSSTDGVLLKGSSDVVSGLIIQKFSNNGIEVAAGANDTIGGNATAGLGNVLSSNATDGVLIDSGVSGTQVQGNFIGTDVTGSKAVGNKVGVEVAGSTNTIGGTTSGAGNIISGNSTNGLLIDSTATGVSVQGNFIGTDVTGTKAVANSIGISVSGNTNTIGGTVAGAGNVISGNTSDGLLIGSGVSGVAVQGNYIGTNLTGLNPLGNSGNGINIAGNKNTVGAGNVISANSKSGVQVSSGSGNTITQNSIFANGASGTGPGITIASGANNNIATPSISSASITAYTLTVKGSFTAATANVPYVLQFFGSPNGDAEGKGYIGSATVTPTSTGTQNFSFNFTTLVPRIYPLVTATLTDNSGDTSAFSNGVSTGKVYVVTSTGDSGTGTLRDAITQANNTTSGITAIDFSIGTSGSAQTISPASALPTLTANNVFINGLSQGGLSNSTQLITLNGSGAGSSDGVLLQGSNDVVSGLIIEGFSKNGIEVAGANNIVGGPAIGQGNVLSGNTTDGLLIDSGVSGVQVQGNYIGTDATGSKVVPNSVGIEVAGSNNTIGGTTSGAGNLISGNTAGGIVTDSSASGNQVLGNFIGTNASGTVPTPTINFPSGFASSGSFFTYNGGAKLNGSNLELTDGGGSEARSIFTTSQVGITNFVTHWTQQMQNPSADGMTFCIQTDGNTAVGGGGGSLGYQGLGKSVAIKFDLYNNSGEGVNSTGLYTDGAAPTVPAIDMTPSGLTLQSGDVMDMTLTYDGTNLTETVYDPTVNKTFTHTYTIDIASVVGSNTAYVGFTGGTGGAAFTGLIMNWTYTTPQPIGNGVGVSISGSHNTIGGSAAGAGNVIGGNKTNGVLVSSGSGNTITHNSIFANTGLGISVASGANNNIVAPTIRSASYIGSTLTVKGSFTAATANVPYVLEFFGNPSTDAEGQVYIGSLTVTPTSTGTQNFTYTTTTTVPTTYPLITATLTDNSGDTSQFSNGVMESNQPPVYVVTSTADDGSPGTLRDAITQASVAGSPITEIDFKIGTVGSAQTINLTSALPTFSAIGVFINGLSQGGSGNATKLITINGTGAGSSSDGLLVQGSDDIVSGLIIENFTKNGIEVAGSSNTIGGTTTGAGNVVSGNGADGILIDSGTSSNLVGGNIVGLTASGGAALANSGNGVEIQGTNNTVGGSVFAARNYIAGSSKDGLLLGSSASGNQVLNNFIGLGTSGTLGVANLNGVEIAGTNNTLGSTVSGTINYISANTNDGVLLDSTATGNLLLGNDVGTDFTGQNAKANSIGIEVAGAGNTLGGTVTAARNLVAGNSSDGVKLDSTASGTLLLGNSIGLNSLAKALGNGGNGLDILSNSNTIGGTASGNRNVISGNSGDGILIASGASGNLVIGDYLGTNIVGTAALGNSGNGLEIGGNSNTVGGTAGAAHNIISGNTGDGIKIDSGASGNSVLGNYVGINAAGTGALSNSIGIEDAGNSNTLGGSVLGARNTISGNTGDGVLLDSTASGNQVLGNYIGLNAGANAAIANSGNGLEVQGTSNTIGGPVYNARNFLAGNSKDGLLLGSSASGNLVLDSFIGLDISGTHGVANLNGVEIAGTNNTLGSTVSGGINYIGGNTNDGVLIDSTATGNLLLSNDVGTDFTGQNAKANKIGIEVAGTGNTLGGTVSAARNLVAGNSTDGVKLDSTASGNLLLGNSIGINSVAKVLANGGNGLNILSNSNTIGGTASGNRNVISGNSGDGILIDSGASGNLVIGNFVGTDIYGKAALGNSGNGIEIGGNGNTIGGTTGQARNIISGNSKDGVKIDSGASGIAVLGDYIGPNSIGTGQIGNGGDGIEDAGSNNTLGGSVTGARDVVSGNGGDGILLDSTETGDTVQGDFLGVNSSANAVMANSGNGLEVQGTNNTIGGVYPARNYISGNSKDGVLLGSNASGNVALDNFIGLDISGTHGIGNSIGVEIAGSNNTLGSTVSGGVNAISGNTGDGVKIDSTAKGNLLLGNNVGTDFSGAKAVANSIGVEVAGTNNTLGGTVTAARNIVSGNSTDGVLIDSTSSGTLVLGNKIGLNASSAALGNGTYGVVIQGNSNTIGGTVSGAGNSIANNKSGGVLVSSGSGDTISRNSIFSNGASNTGPGITINSGANNNLVAPTLTSASVSGTTLTVKGTFNAATANVPYVLEFFANPAGDAEGKIYLGSMTVTPTSTGTQSFTFTTTTSVTGTDPLITATLTDNLGDTSAFSNGVTA